jgi:hypothetical protein
MDKKKLITAVVAVVVAIAGVALSGFFGIDLKSAVCDSPSLLVK